MSKKQDKQAVAEDPKVEFAVEMVAARSSRETMLAVKASSNDLWKVNIDDLHVLPDFNVRSQNEELRAHIRELADSMKTEGYYQDKPLAGFVMQSGEEAKIIVTDGHNRLAAAKLAVSEGAKIGKLPVVIAPKGTTMEDLTVALVRSNSGKKLDPYEQAIVCKRLSRFGWETSEIAKRIGRRLNEVELMLELVSAPRHIRGMLESGQVKASLAFTMLEKHGSKAYAMLEKMVERAKHEGSSRAMPRHAPGAKFERHVRKVAPTLFSTISEVKSDQGYKHISEELRAKIDKIFAELQEVQKAAA